MTGVCMFTATMFKRSAALAASIGIATAAASANANTLGTADVAYAGHVGHIADIHDPGYSGWVYDGLYKLNISNPTGDGSLLPGYGFCIDLYQEASSYATPYQITALSDAPTLGPTNAAGKAAYITQLWDQHFNDAWAGSGTSSTEKSNASAFSLAVWELVTENYQSDPTKYDVKSRATNAGFYATGDSTAEDTANTWLHSLGSSPTPTGGFQLLALTSSNQQDFVSVVPTESAAQSVPLPASSYGVIALLSLLGIAGFVRRQRQRA